VCCLFWSFRVCGVHVVLLCMHSTCKRCTSAAAYWCKPLCSCCRPPPYEGRAVAALCHTGRIGVGALWGFVGLPSPTLVHTCWLCTVHWRCVCRMQRSCCTLRLCACGEASDKLRLQTQDCAVCAEAAIRAWSLPATASASASLCLPECVVMTACRPSGSLMLAFNAGA
jgi:hypothetical protein